MSGREQTPGRDLKAEAGPKPKQNARGYVHRGKKGKLPQKWQGQGFTLPQLAWDYAL